MLIVSLGANFHDSGVAIADENEVLLVVEAERLSRKKKQWCDGPQLIELARYGLASIGKTFDDVTHWCGTAMGNTFLDRRDRICHFTRVVDWSVNGACTPFFLVNHHLAHAALFFAGEATSAVVDACDGGGDERSHIAFRASRTGDSAYIEEIEEFSDGVSAVFYDVASYFLFKKYCQEGKFMGLAAHGEFDQSAYDWLLEHAVPLSTEPHDVGYRMLHQRFKIDAFDPGCPEVRNFAHTAQRAFERLRVEQMKRLRPFGRHLVLTGGAALNIHANSAIRAECEFDSVYVPPACDDSGQALGALLYYANVELGVRPRVPFPFLGLGTAPGEPVPTELSAATADAVAAELLAGKVIAWHWGRAEVGPRALGHRSLLALPTDERQRVLVSEQIKGREAYRPVAPVLRRDDAPSWFEEIGDSPYMLFAATATGRARTEAPAVVHVDGSARIQTIDGDHVLDPILRRLDEACGVPVLINTSLNLRGEPIVQTAEHTRRLAAAKGIPAWVDGVRQ